MNRLAIRGQQLKAIQAIENARDALWGLPLLNI
jgi:hypothetical protein